MAHDVQAALPLVKVRLNRLSSDTSLDAYLTARIDAADAELARIGVKLKADSVDDTMLLTDYVCWQYQNRDSGAAMPDWLRLRRRERWLNGDDT